MWHADSMRKPKFGLRFLLALPLCVGAFFLGWKAHESKMNAMHKIHDGSAQQRASVVRDELARQQVVRAARLNDSVDRMEHRQRMQTFDRLLNDPNAAMLHSERGL
ncbi:hypothetical protein Pla100_14270 [Neorhodopirellula pilleata]|uniref:Uncharacterized protein n=1 Tax=Neorhodopirellula pilleata TaxID=2714738 RepID=A0A5C6ARU4_9BACT|nr:hypothetical protein Pla100_14270 [Neorhodopirellula pilleata]